MSVINTNYLALVSQNNLTKSQNALGTAIERLSSGLRINSAKDDAAGQAIANRFTANIKGLTQAARNANDGISIAQTTEGALNEINNNLQRIRELTVQAANGSNSQSDLDSIQAEIEQRLEEIDRVSRESEFNGRTILGADAAGLTVQVGANDNQTISIGLRTINRDSLGLTGFNVNDAGVTPNTAATLADVQAAGATEIVAGKHYQLSEVNTAATAADVFGTASGVVTVGTATAAGLGNALGWGATAEVGSTDIVGDGQGNYTYSVSKVTDATVATKITADAGEFVLATYAAGDGAVEDIRIDDGGLVTDRNGNALYITADGALSRNDAGGLAQATATTLAQAVSNASDGTNPVGATLSVVGGPTYTGNGTADEIVVTGATTDAAGLGAIATANPTWSFTVGSNVDGIFASVQVLGGNVTVGGVALYVDSEGNHTLASETLTDLYVHDNGNVTGSNGDQYFVDDSGALTTDAETVGPRTTDPLAKLDEALANVDSLRSELGAVQNRFQSTIANLANTVNNLSAARSRIEDADYAVEVSNMTRAQILQQAGTSVLAQANQIPQSVLSLLR